jgi:hypothetical protein
MKKNIGGGGETLTKRRKMSEGDVEEAQNAQSPTSADTEGKHESPDMNRR